MKKIITLTLLVFFSAAAFAENMQFVTLLSQPVGSFAKMDLLGSAPVEIYQLNFCNKGANGTIKIGSEPIDGPLVRIANLNVADTAILAGTIGSFNIENELKVGAGADVNIEYLDIGCSGKFSTGNSTKGSYVEVKGTLQAPLNNGQQTTTVEAASFEKLHVPTVVFFKNAAVGDTKADSFTWAHIGSSANNEYLLVSTTTGGSTTTKECSGESTRSCGCNNDGTQTRTCNTTTGEWNNDWSACTTQDKNCCSNSTYKLANKSTCCPSASTSDTDCYYGYRWVETYFEDLGQCYVTKDPTFSCDINGVNKSWTDTTQRGLNIECTSDIAGSHCDIHYCNGPEENVTVVCKLVKKGW